MSTLTVDDLLARNTAMQATYQARPLFDEFPKLGIPLVNTIIISCADPRLYPEEFFGLHPGVSKANKPKEALVWRTVGGHVRPILRDLAYIDAFIGHGTLTQVLLVHHSDCGATHFTDRAIKDDIIARHSDRKAEIESWEENIAFGHKTLAEGVKEDIAVLKADPFVPEQMKSGVRGFVFDLKTGKVTEV
ncbi:MAG: hypothetical protein Q9159_004669 [Coniocarpon cinnabarinum]